ncbi:MAG: hypothetical protein BMS9Abin24_076 [Thermodesulfobacteriota bacterium]|nr:MAG: hypothetical protein BMS9Abin24_076 [Thermodesulfobacteriota bacterium]
MKYSTGQKKKSRLQGHRKRRRTFEVAKEKGECRLSWMEYKTVRQYQAMGDMLDEFKVYGFKGGVENMAHSTNNPKKENGYGWLTKEPVARADERA